MTDKEIADTLRLAWRYGYPLVGTDALHQGYKQAMNRVYLMKRGADTSTRNIVAYNAETLYAAGMLNLKAEPLILSVPKTGDRLLLAARAEDARSALEAMASVRLPITPSRCARREVRARS